MTAEEAVVDKLLATAAVTALVSQRVHQLILPQHPTYPAIRVQLIDEPEEYQLRGTSQPTYSRVQVDAYERVGAVDAYLTATTIAAAVNDALTVVLWEVGSPPFVVSGVFRKDKRVLYEDEEFKLVRVMQDYRVIGQQM